MASKSENTKLYKQLRTEHLALKQQFEILQESFGMALDKTAELERKLAKALKKILELERKLAQHDNAHTSSSKKAIGQKAKSQHGKPQQNGSGKSGTAKPRGGRRDTREPRTGLPRRALRGTRQTGVPGAACQILQ